MKRIHVLGLVILLTFFSVGAVVAQDDVPELSATLTGAAEVPGPGDTDGSGSANMRVNKEKAEICFTLVVADIGNPTAANIHEGAEGNTGEAVVSLTPLPTDDDSEEKEEDCVTADADLITRIITNPQNFYVNVQNEEFPDGAIRGQLALKEAG